jgi:3-oxoisoapionate decarboxylase
MILGLGSFTYGWAIGVPGNYPPEPMNERQLVELALNASLSCLQIGDNLPLHTFSHERLKALKSIAAENKIRLEVGARKLTAASLERYIQIAGFLESPLLRFVISDEDYDPKLPEVIEIIKDFLPELHKFKITLAIENHDRFKSSDLASMIESIADDHVGICLDCANSLGAGEGLEHVTGILAPYTVNIHLKDFMIQRLPHKMGFTVTGAPLGKGMLNATELLDKLTSVGPCKSAILEQWVVPEKTIHQTIVKEKQWADEGLKYLAQLQYFKNYQTLK